MLILLLGMVLVMLVYVGISDIKMKPENLENQNIPEHRLWDGPASRYDFEKPEYKEIYYLLNFLN